MTDRQIPSIWLPVALAGALGALARWGLTEVWASGRWVWATVAVNVAGTALAAAVVTASTSRRLGAWVLPVVVVGFCGGLTTFSAFVAEVEGLLGDGSDAIAWVAVQVLALAASVAVGRLVGVGWRHRLLAAREV